MVYAKLNGDVANPQVEFIAPVSVPRVSYQQSIGQLLPTHLRRCICVEKLCPACRLFGWVAKDAAPETKEQVAWRGRVRLSHARAVAGTVREFDEGQGIALAILSSPKPTTTLFYLQQSDGSRLVDYNTEGAQLRGRKVYRHHGASLSAQEYQHAGENKDQNRTVRNVVAPGAVFSFTLEFENLAPLELGALLWALELEAGWHHRLGLAKPLGFGSAQVSVTTIELLDTKTRYSALTDGGWRPVAAAQLKEWIKTRVNAFKTALAGHYDNTPFAQLANIADLQALLSAPAKALPIHYPRPPLEDCSLPPEERTKPNPNGNQFEWFVGNKKQAALSLPLAVEDKDGLPLLDKKGNEFAG